MSTLRQQVIDALDQAKYPMWPDRIVEHVSATRHASRVRNMLMDLERDGLVKQSSAGWHRTSVEVQIDRNERKHTLLEREKPTNEVPDMSTIKEQVEAVLRQNPGLTSKEISEWLPNINRQNIYAIVSAMTNEGMLERSLIQPFRYSLKSEDESPVQEQQQDPEGEQVRHDPDVTDNHAVNQREEPPEHEPIQVAHAVVSTEKTIRAIRILQSSANQAREALETYLDSIDDPVLTHLMNAVNEADQAVDAYAARNPK